MISRPGPMAVLETKREQTTLRADGAVFVARDGRRARRLRNAAIVVGVLAILWVVGLTVGMLGFGSLPGVALVKGVASHARPADASAQPAAEREVSRLLAADDTAARHQARTSTNRRTASVGVRHPSSTRKRSRRPAAIPPAANAQVPVNPSQRTRGWSRRGYSAPRGQARKAAPPPPPATSRGRRVGRQKPLPAPPPPGSPGQAKKAAQPPPPPPPPPKKG
jgi:hypothetical protein